MEPVANSEMWAERFLAYLRDERALTPHTIGSYEHDLRRFFQSIAKDVTQVDRGDIRAFLNARLQQGANPRTVARALSALHHFFRFLLDEGAVSKDPTTNIPWPKTWDTLPKALPSGAIQVMADALDRSSPLGLRDLALLQTAFGSGARVSEITSLELEDLDLAHSLLTVRQGKGSKDRFAPLNPVAIQALNMYLEIGRPQLCSGNGSPFVFLGRTGKPLTRQAVFARLRKLAQRTLGKKISPHWLRHSFGTALLAGGADLRTLQELMGHASIDSTQIYLKVDLAALRETYYATHPRARLK